MRGRFAALPRVKYKQTACRYHLIPNSSLPTRDAVAGVLWVLTNLVLVAAARAWARRLMPGSSYLDHIGHTIVLWWGVVVVVSVGLGCCGALTGAALLGVVAVGSVAMLGVDLHCRSDPQTWRSSQSEWVWLRVWFAVLCFGVAFVAVMGLARFHPTPTLSHTTFRSSTSEPDQSLWGTRSNRWTSPGNNELVALWVVAPFSGDFLVAFNNSPAVALLVCAAVSFAVRLGIPRSLAHCLGWS